MLTMVSVPKPFRGHIGTIQANAVQSWRQLSPACEIILFGDEGGISEASAWLGVRHVPHVARNEYGTPLLDDVLRKARVTARHPLMCYVNADIILMSDFLRAVEQLVRWQRPFLMAGRRWDIALDHSLDFGQPNWEEALRAVVRASGAPRPPGWVDYFVFGRELYREVPHLAIGRALFDNWLLWQARSLGAALVDASDAVMAIHQQHDYSHHSDGQQGVWEGAEAKRNAALMGGWHHCFTLSDSTHRLSPDGLRRNLSGQYFRRRAAFAWMAFVAWSAPLRYRLGLRRSNTRRLWNRVRRSVGTERP